MIGLTLFYLLFLILLILLIFLVLLYTGYHNRTLAPPLLDAFYGINGSAGGNIPESTGTFETLTLTDGEGTFTGVSGSLDFGAAGANNKDFGFQPMWDDAQRKLKGNITLLINKQDNTTPDLNLQLIDTGDNNHVIAKATKFDIKEHEKGLSEIKLYFTTRSLSGTSFHHFVLQGKSSSGTSITNNQILLNSAYMYYY